MGLWLLGVAFSNTAAANPATARDAVADDLSGVEIRPVEEGDVESLVTWLKRQDQKRRFSLFRSAATPSDADLKRYIFTPRDPDPWQGRHTFLAADEGGEILGWATTTRSKPDDVSPPGATTEAAPVASRPKSWLARLWPPRKMRNQVPQPTPPPKGGALPPKRIVEVMICVTPGCGKTLTDQLTRSVLADAARHGVHEMIAMITTGNRAARTWAERNQFRQVPTRTDAFQDAFSDQIFTFDLRKHPSFPRAKHNPGHRAAQHPAMSGRTY